MSGAQRAIVTGATNGIGEAIARQLAARGFTVVLVGRSDQRLAEASRRIQQETPSAQLVLERADLALLSEVQALARRFTAQPPPDVVISNAAVIAPLDDLTSEGLPRVVATNHLAAALLLRSLADAPAIRERGTRFVLVGADPVGLARRPVDVSDLVSIAVVDNVPEELRPFAAYGVTKNMNAMFTYALARRLSTTRITVNAAHPGIIGDTGLGQNVPGLREAVGRHYTLTDLPGPDRGADTPVWLATAAELAGVTGCFFVDRQQVTTAPHTTDERRCDQLWDETARLIGLEP